MSAVAKISPEDDGDSDVLTPEPIESEHILVLGNEEFACADQLPTRTLIRYANGGIDQIHHILVKLVEEEDVERMWDAFEAMESDDAAMDAISLLIETYAETPTKRPASSRSGSKTTKRK